MTPTLENLVSLVNGSPKVKVGPKTTLTPDDKGVEVVATDPAELAKSAGIEPNLYAMARAIHSEEGNADGAVLIAVGEVIRNRALQLKKSVFEVVTGARGKFGRQTGGQFVSSALDPTEKSIMAAKSALDWKTNLAGGATKFFNPKAQDIGKQKGALKYDAVSIIQKWADEGFKWIGAAPLYRDFSVNPYTFMVLGLPGASHGAPLTAAISVVSQGRKGLLPKPLAPVV